MRLAMIAGIAGWLAAMAMSGCAATAPAVRYSETERDLRAIAKYERETHADASEVCFLAAEIAKAVR